MRKIFLLSILVGITFLSCSDNLENPIFRSHNNNLVSSPSQISISKVVNGEIGDRLILNETYLDMSGKEMSVYVELLIPPNSFNSTVNITIEPDFEDLSIQFFPEMTFNEIIALDVVFTGINTSTTCYKETAEVQFAYFADNGLVEIIENDESSINTLQRIISVQNAKLSHFSRYGWIR